MSAIRFFQFLTVDVFDLQFLLSITQSVNLIADIIKVGIAGVLESWLHLGRFWFTQILLSIFGLSLALTGTFHHAPMIEGAVFNSLEDKLHSIFASSVGFSFIIFAISSPL